MRNLKIKPATMAYAKEFYGNKFGKSFKGHVALLNNEVVGVAGLTKLEDGTMLLFSDMKEKLRPLKRDIVMSILVIKEMVEKINYPIVSVASKKEKAAKRILERLGFIPSGNSTPDGSEIYWRIP